MSDLLDHHLRLAVFVAKMGKTFRFRKQFLRLDVRGIHTLSVVIYVFNKFSRDVLLYCDRNIL